MKRTNTIIGITILLWLLTACAGVTHKPISSIEDSADEGIRYFGSSYYLFLYSNGKGGLITEIKSLPDPNKKMSAKPYSFLSSLDLTMNFVNGVLTSSEETADSTAIPKAVIAAAEKVASLLLQTMNLPSKQLELPAPYVYKIVLKSDSIEFVGGSAEDRIKISLLPQTDGSK
ncbi:MAG: hypothetical protein DU489_05970 [Nitrosomonas sp.]|uniref:hypothetical protein n=1 Tax=Nitrosomonas sp. TaxID=42353 RepID=UPI0032EBAF63